MMKDFGCIRLPSVDRSSRLRGERNSVGDGSSGGRPQFMLKGSKREMIY
jgi:hypothetical protein